MRPSKCLISHQATRPARGPVAHWLPATGQRACYDAHRLRIEAGGSGQDGAIQAGWSWPALRFSAKETGVIDHLTGLCWHRCAKLADGEVSWEDALAGIAALNAGAGPDRWRLPNINELESLVDCGRARPSLAAPADVFDRLDAVIGQEA